ncbi:MULTISPECIES: hypothetical protein [Tenacibaculum]|uniref:hypothetical protein n=1 Tax=Tenacibaculum TaxID=104267 RepID=UPI0015E07A99|nr:hypothetical protein [Tenacibaculum finnmarkense]MBE7698684.1 hypothetical protein [Tenacibaculum finnmarkense genomovar ulcerans]
MATKIDKLNTSKVPIIVFDKKLEELQDRVLFPKKLEKAKKILAKVGLPKKK